ncbi:hypothetical protein Plhal710r2_c045g0147881 [Plasmopara halstedii]
MQCVVAVKNFSSVEHGGGKEQSMKLRCGVYGKGSVFSVEIKRNADVESLQKAIVNEKKDVNDCFKVDPAKLMLGKKGKPRDSRAGGAAAGDGKAKEPPNKKQRLELIRISLTGQEGYLKKRDRRPPIVPIVRSSSKTTIAYRIMDWISSDISVANVKYVFFEMPESDVAEEGTFWNRLGRCIDNRYAGCDYDSFLQLVEESATQDRK